MNICYVVIETNAPGERIGMVKKGEMGYYTMRRYDFAPDTIEEVRTNVSELNRRLGVPDDVADSARDASMWGWHVPAAKVANDFFAGKEAK